VEQYGELFGAHSQSNPFPFLYVTIHEGTFRVVVKKRMIC